MSDHHDEHHEHSIVPHVYNLLALFFLTTLTWASATYIKLGEPWDNLIALAIAFTKATLVILIFMHVKEASKLIKVCAISGFFWIFLFFAYLVGDIVTRPGHTTYEGWQPEIRKPLGEPVHHGDGHGGGHSEGHGGGGH